VLAQVADTSIPFEKRREAILATARRGDVAGLRELMAVGDAGVYASYAAVEALGELRKPALATEARTYLERKLADPDSQLARAAIAGYSRLLGPSATPELVAALDRNRERTDGYQELVCLTIVRCLAAQPEPSAVKSLEGELERVGCGVWGLEYGSEVVAALGRIGTPAARAAAGRYADRLAAEMPNDPLAKRNSEDRIAEARSVANVVATTVH
jgi:hypothetical protein